MTVAELGQGQNRQHRVCVCMCVQMEVRNVGNQKNERTQIVKNDAWVSDLGN